MKKLKYILDIQKFNNIIAKDSSFLVSKCTPNKKKEKNIKILNRISFTRSIFFNILNIKNFSSPLSFILFKDYNKLNKRNLENIIFIKKDFYFLVGNVDFIDFFLTKKKIQSFIFNFNLNNICRYIH